MAKKGHKGSTIDEAAATYAAKTPQMVRNQAAGLTHFLGFDASNTRPVRRYAAKMADGAAVSAKWKARTLSAYGSVPAV